MASLIVIKSGQLVETLQFGALSIEILEDGSNTSNRFGSITAILPPQTKGPPEHEHILHNETFLVTRGTMRSIAVTLSTTSMWEITSLPLYTRPIRLRM